MSRDYQLLDVFTERPFGGNQLAVFTDGSGMGAETMQAVARELNLSETVFVLPAEEGGDFRLRIFTPAMELPFAGHPTVGAALVLAEATDLSNLALEEAAGRVDVRIDRREGRRFATLTAPRLSERLPIEIESEAVAASLGAAPGALAPIPAAAYSAGVPFLFAPLAGAEALAAAAVDLPVWRTHIADSRAPHIAALWMQDWRNGGEVHLRMFAPAMGITEDPATGAAAAALAGLLVDLQQPQDGTTHWLVRQGEAMGRPSRIYLEADVENGRAAAIRVGGTAVMMGRGSLEV